MEIILKTERLYLRKFILEDAMHFYQLNKDPEVIKYTGDPPFESQKAAQQFITNYDAYERTGIGRYAIVRIEDDEFLGWCGLKYHPSKRVVDLGYRLYRCYWGQGYASESAQGCVEYAFAKARLPHLIAQAHIDNVASQLVLKSCNFSYREQCTYDGAPTYIYQLENPDYTLKQITAKETWVVRHTVLRTGRPLKDVYMQADEIESTFHLGILYKNEVVGVASFMQDAHKGFEGIQSRLRGMAVLPKYRKKGLAQLLLRKGETILKERGRTLLWFNARLVALNFYKKMGYEVVGDQFEIPLVGTHYRMRKKL